jgi:uncharacterized membrane protein
MKVKSYNEGNHSTYLRTTPLNRNRVLLVTATFGFAVLATAMFVGTRLAFRDQPDVENVFSIIWTTALVVLLYLLWRNWVATRSPSRQERQRAVYGVIRLMMEMIAVMALLFTAIMTIVVLTSPGDSSQLIPVVGITALLALVLIAIPRITHVLDRRALRTDKHPDL